MSDKLDKEVQAVQAKRGTPLKISQNLQKAVHGDKTELEYKSPEPEIIVQTEAPKPKPAPEPEIIKPVQVEAPKPKPAPEPEIIKPVQVEAPKPKPAPEPEIIKPVQVEAPKPKPAPEPEIIKPVQVEAPKPKPAPTAGQGMLEKTREDLSLADTGLLSRLAKEELDKRGESSKYLEKTKEVEKKRKESNMKTWLIGVLFFIFGCAITILSIYFQSNLQDKDKEAESIRMEVEQLQEKLSDMENTEDSLKKTLDAYMEKKAYNKVLQTADRIHDEYPDSETDKYAQKKVKEAKEKLEKLGMETGNSDDKKDVKYEDYKGINFDKLASNSKNYLGEKAKFYGKVLQIEEGKDTEIRVIRLAVDDDINKMMVVQYEVSDDIQIEEGDYVNTGGIIVTDLTYKTVLGTKLTVPAMSAVYVDKVA